MSEHEKPLPSLEALQQKIEKVQAHSGMKSEGEDASGSSGGAMQVGVELVSGVAVGCFIGYYLDHWMGTKPLLFIVCFFVGAAAGFKNLLRQAKEDHDRS